MFLHQQLRKARKQAKMTQGQLAQLAGIPRQQVVRAERGDNITLETLRSIAAHLPITHLTLLENVQLTADLMPQPAKIHFAAMETVIQTFSALRLALNTAMASRLALEDALQREPLRVEAGLGKVTDEEVAVVQEMDEWLRRIGQLADPATPAMSAWTAGPQGPEKSAEDLKKNLENLKANLEDLKKHFEGPQPDVAGLKADVEGPMADAEGSPADAEGPQLDPRDSATDVEAPKAES